MRHVSDVDLHTRLPFEKIEFSAEDTRVIDYAVKYWMSEVELQNHTLDDEETKVAEIAKFDVSKQFPTGVTIHFPSMDSVRVLACVVWDYLPVLHAAVNGRETLLLDNTRELAFSLAREVDPMSTIPNYFYTPPPTE